MNTKIIIAILMIVILVLAGCRVVSIPPEPGPPPPPSMKAKQPFKIPPGHLPPPGECRIWYPSKPPGQQLPPGDCAELADRVPLGAWLITRPINDRDKLKVFVYDMNRPNVVVVIRWYHAFTGEFLSEKKK